VTDHLVEVSGGVMTVTLNRPEVRNALDDKLIAGLTQTFAGVGDDVIAVILKGEGKAFCAGGDLSWMQRSIDYTEAENLADAQALGGLFLAIDDCPCPVIGQVHGAAFGGGVGLACVCDIVIAAEGTKFCFSEVKLGLSPAVISAFAIRKIGLSQARRYFLTAEVFEAEEARSIGLAHETCAVVDIVARVQHMIDALRANGPRAVRQAKALAKEVAYVDSRAALDASSKVIAALRVSPEGQEGVRAFLEKRPARWPSFEVH
jgi:methylglutaconyl-CoA hydratase